MKFLLPATRLTVLCALSCLLLACEPTDPPSAKPAGVDRPAAENAPDDRPPAEWDRFVLDYMESWFVAHPAFAVVQGRHKFDGMLP
ncbi:MAG: hypothetical protein RQ826_10130, partial [Xanthomonadales bacterium]|nr:hypothetical protein [Xanthomonadales bacterium]